MKTWADTGIDTKGKASGEVKTTCPRCSAARRKKSYPCLNVNLDKGMWHCWHCGWAGSLSKGEYSSPTILKRHYRRPDYVAQSTGLPEKVVAWFHGRGITEAVLRRNQVGHGSAYFPQVEEERTCVLFPYRRGGDVVNVKYRTGDKLFRMEGGCERVLYGLDDIDKMLVWVEGEMDKLSMEVAGYTSCVSVPDGAPAPDSKSYESKFDFLDAPEIGRASTHLIAVDNDAPGLRLRDELVRRLGPDKCLIVDWPDGCKDANDVLVKLGPNHLITCVQNAREMPIEGAHEVTDYMDAINRVYEHGIPGGISTGWRGIDAFYRPRPGDVTVITGAPNSGKSEWLDALMINMARAHGWRFAVFSPEQGSPEEHVAKLLEKFIGKPFNRGPRERINATEKDIGTTWLREHVILLDPEEPSLSHLLETAKHLVLRRGVRGVILDPWNEIETARPEGVTETEHIGQSLRMIRRFARQHQVKVWIVAHPKQLQKDPKTGQYPVVGPYEISGSANWHNKPDVCISIWRERNPEKATTEVEVHVQKVKSKYAGRLGMARLHWDMATGRYSDIERDAEGREVEFSYGGAA